MKGRQAMFGPLTFTIMHNVWFQEQGKDAYNAQVTLGNFTDYLFGGERFKTEEQIMAAVESWAKDVVQQMLLDLEAS